MYKHAGRLFFGAQGQLDVQPVFGGYSEEGEYKYLRFIPRSWSMSSNPDATWDGKDGRSAYCEVKLCNAQMKLQIGLLNDQDNVQQVLFQAFQRAGGTLKRLPANTDAFPKYWQATILPHQGKARQNLLALNWPVTDIDNYLGAQIAFNLSQILTSPDFNAASAQVVAILS